MMVYPKGRAKMRSLLTLSSIALLGVGVGACGGSGKGAGSSSQATATTARTVATVAKGDAVASGASATPSAAVSSFKGDEDDDETASNHTSTSNKYDNDADFDNDTIKNKGYYDSDDSVISASGKAASAAQKRTIAALVKRYYAAAAASDGAKACPLIYSTLEEAIPEDYGQPPGPSYSRGKTCAVVMSKTFAHAHSQLAGGFAVTGVRVEGREARALLGSRTLPASFILLRRERGAWKISELLGQPLP
jgi:hypothetical protein